MVKTFSLILLSLVSLTCTRAQFLFFQGRQQIVFGWQGLQQALNDTGVDSILISGPIKLPYGWSAPIITNRNLTFAGDPTQVNNTLNFGGQLAAVVVGQNASVEFRNLSMQGAGPQKVSLNASNANIVYQADGLGMWPSLILQPGANILFNSSTLQYYSQIAWSRCSSFSRKVILGLQQQGFGDDITAPNNVTLRVGGGINVTTAVRNFTTQAVVGNVTMLSINTTMICVDDPYPQDASISAVPSAATTHGSRFKWWYGLIIGLGAAFLLALGALATFLILSRRRRKAKEKLLGPAQHQASASTSLEPSLASATLSQVNGSHNGSPSIKIMAQGTTTMSSSSGPRDGLAPPSHTSIASDLGSEHLSQELRNGGTGSWAEIGNLLRARTDFNDFELGPLIGKGSFGRVYKGRWKGAFVAIKIVDHKEAAHKMLAAREGNLSHSVQHPNVITTYNVFTQQIPTSPPGMWSGEQESDGSPSRPDIVMNPRTASQREMFIEDDSLQFATILILEYADRGTLERAVSAKRFQDKTTGEVNVASAQKAALCTRFLPIQTTLDLLQRAVHLTLLDIAGGIDYLHSVGVVHGDLKGANVLLKSTAADNRGFTAKLADFGMARLLSENSTHVSTQTYGTISYMPVEVLKEGKLTKAVDSYSFAILMWELFSSQILYQDITVAQLYYKVCVERDKPGVPPQMPPEYASLMERCWNDDPEARPSSSEILAYLCTLPAHRRVSKEPGSLPSALKSSELASTREASFRQNSSGPLHSGQSTMSRANSAMPPTISETGPAEGLPGRVKISTLAYKETAASPGKQSEFISPVTVISPSPFAASVGSTGVGSSPFGASQSPFTQAPPPSPKPPLPTGFQRGASLKSEIVLDTPRERSQSKSLRHE